MKIYLGYDIIKNMAIEAVKAIPVALAPKGRAGSSNPKNKSTFDDLLAVFQAQILGEFRNLSFNFKEASPGQSSEDKIQVMAAGPETKKAENSGNEKAAAASKTGQPNESSKPIEKAGPDSKAELIRIVYSLFGQTPAVGWVNNPLLVNNPQATLADEINVLIDEVIKQVKIAKVDGLEKMDLFFRQENLGNLKISLTFDKNQLNIEMILSPETKSLLEPYLAKLVEKLQEAGISVGGLSVTLKENRSDEGFNQEPEGLDLVPTPAVAPDKSDSENLSQGTGSNNFLKAWVKTYFAGEAKNLIETLV